METRTIKVTLIDEMLGTNPSDKKIYDKYIASKAPTEDAMNEDMENFQGGDNGGLQTIFIKDENGNPLMACYHMYGFFKSACGYLKKVDKTESSKVKAYKKFIDGLIKVYPGPDITQRYIRLNLPEGTEIGDCQRSLRAQTMQGERVALASSETVPAGTTFQCDICLWDESKWPLVEEWLDYGKFNGLGQWRSSGKGAFTWEYVKEDK